MKKALRVIISFCLLFIIFFANTQTQAEEKEHPTSYQYTFTVGSADFHGVVDGVEGTGTLLYPLYIDETCGRAGIDFWFPCPAQFEKSLFVDYNYCSDDGKPKAEMTFAYQANTLLLIYPNQTAFINEEEIPFDFFMQSVDGVNRGAMWNGEKYGPWAPVDANVTPSTYLIPIRFLFENTGHKVDWNPDTQEITVTYPAPETEE